MPKKNELYYNKLQYQKYKKVKVNRIGYYVGDLLEFQKSTATKKSIYIFLIQDIFSRMLGGKIINNKDKETCLDAYKYIVEFFFWDINPTKFITDSGNEFLFDDYLEEQGTEHYQQKGNSLKNKSVKLGACSIIERTNGIVRKMLADKMDETKENLNKKILLKVIEKFNNKYHTSLGEASPYEVFAGDKIPQTVENRHNKKNKNSAPMDFEVGTRCRIVMQMNDMEENSKRKQKNTSDVYTIVKRKGNKYKLNGYDQYFPYTRIVVSKDPPTENPSYDFKPPKIKNSAPKFTEKELQKKYRVQPKGIKALLEYNALWKDHNGYEMKDGKREIKK